MNKYPARSGAFSRQGGAAQARPGAIHQGHAENGEGTIIMELINGGATDLTYVIGDGDGVYAANNPGLTINNPDGGSITPAVLKANLSTRPCTIGQMHIEVSDGVQFSESIKQIVGSWNGGDSKKALPLAKYSTPMDNRDDVKVVNFPVGQEPVLSGHEGIMWVVKAGKTATVTLTLRDYRAR